MKPLSNGKYTITFQGGLLDDSVTPGKMKGNNESFALPLGWDYETRYELVVLPSNTITIPIEQGFPQYDIKLDNDTNLGDII